jgi:hypothetical protein
MPQFEVISKASNSQASEASESERVASITAAGGRGGWDPYQSAWSNDRDVPVTLVNRNPDNT